MYYKPLLLPLLVQVLLTFIVMLRMYRSRVSEFKRKKIHPQSVSTRKEFREKLTDSAAAADNFSNLFEMPVLFYTVVLLALILLVEDTVLVALAWMFVILRIVHSYIHTTYNTVMHRFMVFAASCAVLFFMWARVGWYILIR